MSLAKKLFKEKRYRVSGNYHPSQPPSDWLMQVFHGLRSGDTASGVVVTPQTALSNTAVWASNIKIAFTFASTRAFHYRARSDGGKDRITSGNISSILKNGPNPQMTSYTWQSLGAHHLLHRGNHFSHIRRNKATGEAVEIWPLPPDSVGMAVNKDGSILYTFTLPDGSKKVFDPENIFHVKYFSPDGLWGYDPISVQEERIASAIAVDEYGSRFFGNNANPSGMLESTDGKRISDDAWTRLKRQVEDLHKGLERAHKLMVVPGGLKYLPTGVPPENAQFNETKKHETRQVATMMNMPAHYLNEAESVKYNNVEMASIEFIRDTMRPIYVNWEQEFTKALVTADNEFVEFKIDSMLRADTKTRFEAYEKALNNGFLNRDEVRSFENMNPLPDGSGQIFTIPTNNLGNIEDLDEEEEQDTGTGDDVVQDDQTTDDDERSLIPFWNDAIERIETRERKDNGKINTEKHKEFIRTVFSPYAQAAGDKFDLEKFIESRIKELTDGKD